MTHALQDVRSFLNSLKEDCPELFDKKAPPAMSPPETRLVRGRHREQAETRIFERAAYWGARMGLRPKRVAVTNPRSMWGYCTADGVVRFSWRLALAPPEVLDYVVVHELAHLVEMNHSTAFWTIVERHCPDRKARRRWLNKEGHTLVLNRRRPSS